MLELAIEHPRHDLHVTVRMGLEAGAARDSVVVQHEELPMVGVVRGVVAPEAEGVLRVEPAGAGVEPVGRRSDVDGAGAHDRANRARRSFISVRKEL